MYILMNNFYDVDMKKVITITIDMMNILRLSIL